MAGSIEGARAKWERACEHRDALKEACTLNVPEAPGLGRYPVYFEADPDGLHYSGYVDQPEFDSERAAIIAGDCFFNLRSALDHIVYALHERSNGGPLPEGPDRAPAFPIHPCRPTKSRGRLKPSSEWNPIKALAYKQRRAIEWLQPYNRRNDALKDTREALGILDRINQIDKHRHLHVVLMEPGWQTLPVTASWDEYGFCQKSLWVPLEGKTKVREWTFAVAPPSVVLQTMQMNQNVTTVITVRERSGTWALLGIVEVAIEAVEYVLNRFALFLR